MTVERYRTRLNNFLDLTAAFTHCDDALLHRDALRHVTEALVATRNALDCRYERNHSVVVAVDARADDSDASATNASAMIDAWFELPADSTIEGEAVASARDADRESTLPILANARRVRATTDRRAALVPASDHCGTESRDDCTKSDAGVWSGVGDDDDPLLDRSRQTAAFREARHRAKRFHNRSKRSRRRHDDRKRARPHTAGS